MKLSKILLILSISSFTLVQAAHERVVSYAQEKTTEEHEKLWKEAFGSVHNGHTGNETQEDQATRTRHRKSIKVRRGHVKQGNKHPRVVSESLQFINHKEKSPKKIKLKSLKRHDKK